MNRYFVKPTYFVWIIVPVIIWAVYHSIGLPHFIWSYKWLNNGTYDPRAERYYTSCSFIGAYGEFEISNPANGYCDWFIFRTNPKHRKKG